jgi:hypothetical protein
MKDLPADFSGSIPLENRYHFTNTSQCNFYWALVNYRKPNDQFTGYDVMKNGKAVSPSVEPNGAKGTIGLGLPSDWKNYDALVLSAFDPAKNLLYKWSWKIKTNEALLAGILAVSDTVSTSLAETDSTYTLNGGDVSIVIGKDGLIKGVRNKQSDALSFGKGPVLVSGSASVSGTKTYKEGAAQVVEVTYNGNMKSAKWKMNGSGWLSLEYEYELNGTYPFAGISFTYPENFVLGAKWLGKGPYRVWKNRLQGVTENVWQNAYNNTQTGSAPWLFPEFKGYFAGITWMELNTVEGKFMVATKDTGLYVRLFDFYALSGVKPHPDLPVGNLSFLDAIPPIGTKLALNISANTTQLGPQSEPNKINGTTRRTLYFYFGLPKPDNSKKQFTMPAVNDLF